jgi:hypothetical protein
MYGTVFDFLHLKFFNSHITINLMKLIHFSILQKLKSQDFFKNLLFMVQIRSRNRNRNLSKVGTVTVTSQKSEPEQEP